MSELLEVVRKITTPDRLDEQRPLVLRESQRTDCGPIRVDGGSDHVALRLGDRDFLPLLAQLPKAESVRKLPDYLIFADPPTRTRRSRRDLLLQVVLCELKSGKVGAEAAIPQLRCGKLLAKYLVGLAALHLATPRGELTENIEVCYYGIVAVPHALIQKGFTRPGADPNHLENDPLGNMPIRRIGDKGIVELDSLIPTSCATR